MAPPPPAVSLFPAQQLWNHSKNKTADAKAPAAVGLEKNLEAIVEAGAEEMPAEISLVGEDVGGKWNCKGREIGAGDLESRTNPSSTNGFRRQA